MENQPIRPNKDRVITHCRNPAIELTVGPIVAKRHHISDLAAVVEKEIVSPSFDQVQQLVLSDMLGRAHIIAADEADEHFVHAIVQQFVHAQSRSSARTVGEPAIEKFDFVPPHAWKQVLIDKNSAANSCDVRHC